VNPKKALLGAPFLLPPARRLAIAALLTAVFWLPAAPSATADSAAPEHVTQTARVNRVVDGDSLILDDGRELRLIGINAPEYGRSCLPGTHASLRNCTPKPTEPLAREAHAFLARLVEGRMIVLEIGQEPTDRYGRTLAHARLTDGTDVQAALLKQGLAWLVAIPPNVTHVSGFQTIEHEVRAQRRGVWGLPAYTPKPAEALTMNDTGFRLVQGTVRRVGQSSKAWYLDLTPRVTIRIPRKDWKKYFTGKPEEWLNRHVEARGWWLAYQGRLRLHARHPAMLTWQNPS